MIQADLKEWNCVVEGEASTLLEEFSMITQFLQKNLEDLYPANLAETYVKEAFEKGFTNNDTELFELSKKLHDLMIQIEDFKETLLKKY